MHHHNLSFNPTFATFLFFSSPFLTRFAEKLCKSSCCDLCGTENEVWRAQAELATDRPGVQLLSRDQRQQSALSS